MACLHALILPTPSCDSTITTPVALYLTLLSSKRLPLFAAPPVPYLSPLFSLLWTPPPEHSTSTPAFNLKMPPSTPVAHSINYTLPSGSHVLLLMRFYPRRGILLISDHLFLVEVQFDPHELSLMYLRHTQSSCGVMPCLQGSIILPCSSSGRECKLKQLIKMAFHEFSLGMSARPPLSLAEVSAYDKTARRFSFDSSFLNSLPSTTRQVSSFLSFASHFRQSVPLEKPLAVVLPIRPSVMSNTQLSICNPAYAPSYGELSSRLHRISRLAQETLRVTYRLNLS